MPNTINIVQPKAEDGVTEVSFVTRTNSIFKSDGSPLGDSLDEYMDEVDELSQNLTKILYEKSYTSTTQTYEAAFNDFYSNVASIVDNLDVARCGGLMLEINGYYYKINRITSSGLFFSFLSGGTGTGATSFIFYIASLMSSGSKYVSNILNGSTQNLADRSANTHGGSLVMRIIG